MEIVSVGRHPLSGSAPGVNVETILDRQDVNVTLSELPRGRKPIAGTLVEYCEKTGAGLLAMDAYEHALLREGLIGGVTDDIALRTRILVLMSH